LQNYGSSKAPVHYFVFDVRVLAARDVMREPLEVRRDLLEKKILPKTWRTSPICRAAGREFASARWTQRQDIGARPAPDYAMAFDTRSVAVMFGGSRDCGAGLGDTCELHGD
jgi:hypothetical protein